MGLIMTIIKMGSATLYNGDCHEVMQDLPMVDSVITDPPYGVKISVGKKWDDEPQIDWVNDAFNLLIDGGAMLSFCSKEFTFLLECEFRKLLKFRNRYIWLKNASGFAYSKKHPTTQHEDILFFTKGDHYFYDCYATFEKPNWDKPTSGRKSPTTFSCNSPDAVCMPAEFKRLTTVLNGRVKNALPHDERTKHPSQKPVEVLKILCAAHTKPSGLILDPFMGSGSTALACKETGHKFIGSALF